MQPFAKFHPATLIDLHEWSTLSRNEIRPFLARFGVEPLGSKYPMLRVYEAVLGLSPTGEIDEKIPGQNIRELLQSSRAVLRDALADVRTITGDAEICAPGPPDFDARARWAGARLQDILATLHCAMD